MTAAPAPIRAALREAVAAMSKQERRGLTREEAEQFGEAFMGALRQSVTLVPDPRDARIAELEAEVARLRGEVTDILAENDAARFMRNTAYARGAAAMREAAAVECWRVFAEVGPGRWTDAPEIGKRIRALPVPEEREG